jgi:hypothetical protein
MASLRPEAPHKLDGIMSHAAKNMGLPRASAAFLAVLAMCAGDATAAAEAPPEAMPSRATQAWDSAAVAGRRLPSLSPLAFDSGYSLRSDALHEKPCSAPWLQCAAFVRVETRLMGYNEFFDAGVFRDDPEAKRRTLVEELMLGLRFEVPDTRGANHGPWFLQFKVTRRTPAVRSSIPIPRHTAAALTFGIEF